jgi:regulator of sigma E protease
MDFLITLLQFIGALVALIIIHELGHFLAARAFKVEVEEFGIFFPPRITTLFQWRETKFTLNAIPLGGFVRPKGENDPEVPGGLAAANPWVRLAVLFAGPMANLLTAVVLYAVIIAQVGVQDPTRIMVAGVAEGSPAMTAGLREGDIVVSVAGRTIDSQAAIQSAIGDNLDRPTELVYERSGRFYETTLTPRGTPPEGQGPIGIILGYPTSQVSVIQAIPAGFQSTYLHSAAILSLPGELIRGDVDPDMGRPVGFKGMFDIFQGVREGEIITEVPVYIGVLFFITNITVSLGLLNLIPFPALDGGRILFTLPEIILRRRVPPQYENIIHLVGFAILLTLLIYINIQDFLVPITLPR